MLNYADYETTRDIFLLAWRDCERQGACGRMGGVEFHRLWDYFWKTLRVRTGPFAGMGRFPPDTNKIVFVRWWISCEANKGE